MAAISLGARVGALEHRVGTLEHAIETLDGDIAEIKGRLADLATRDDVRAVVDGSINGVLRDALNALPGRWSAVFMSLTIIITVAALAMNLVHGH